VFLVPLNPAATTIVGINWIYSKRHIWKPDILIVSFDIL